MCWVLATSYQSDQVTALGLGCGQKMLYAPPLNWNPTARSNKLRKVGEKKVSPGARYVRFSQASMERKMLNPGRLSLHVNE
jgi:hypothetical protein